MGFLHTQTWPFLLKAQMDKALKVLHEGQRGRRGCGAAPEASSPGTVTVILTWGLEAQSSGEREDWLPLLHRSSSRGWEA